MVLQSQATAGEQNVDVDEDKVESEDDVYASGPIHVSVRISARLVSLLTSSVHRSAVLGRSQPLLRPPKNAVWSKLETQLLLCR